MTEPNPRGEEVVRAVHIAKFKADTERWERKIALRRKIAYWSLIPYCAFAGGIGLGVGRVLNSGDIDTGILLIASYSGVLALQWIMPDILRRREAAMK